MREGCPLRNSVDRRRCLAFATASVLTVGLTAISSNAGAEPFLDTPSVATSAPSNSPTDFGPPTSTADLHTDTLNDYSTSVGTEGVAQPTTAAGQSVLDVEPSTSLPSLGPSPDSGDGDGDGDGDGNGNGNGTLDATADSKVVSPPIEADERTASTNASTSAPPQAYIVASRIPIEQVEPSLSRNNSTSEVAAAPAATDNGAISVLSANCANSSGAPYFDRKTLCVTAEGFQVEEYEVRNGTSVLVGRLTGYTKSEMTYPGTGLTWSELTLWHVSSVYQNSGFGYNITSLGRCTGGCSDTSTGGGNAKYLQGQVGYETLTTNNFAVSLSAGQVVGFNFAIDLRFSRQYTSVVLGNMQPRVTCDNQVAAQYSGCAWLNAYSLLTYDIASPRVTEVAQHVRDAQNSIFSHAGRVTNNQIDGPQLTRIPTSGTLYNQNISAKDARCSTLPPRTGTQCDEYPFASTAEGGNTGDFSVRRVIAAQNSSAGSDLGYLYAAGRVAYGDGFYVRVVG
jgi:hypothetical protein